MTSKIDIGRYVVSPMGIYCILLAVAVANGQLAEKLTSQNPCVSKTTCHECIQTKSCAWCLQPQAEYGDLPRCFQPSYGVGDSRCPEEYTYNPDNEMIPLLNMELTRRVSGAAAEGGGGAAASGYSASGYSASGSSYSSMSSSSSHYGSSSSSSGSTYGFGAASGGIVQISPQRVKLKLRINEEYHLNMRYSQAEDYPIDLYYLMDLSKSMEDDKHSLSYLGNSLSETMRNITSNFRLGFGSFVDKVLMPYVSTVPKKLEHPCDGCEAPYGFKNHMALSMDTMNFSKEVSEASVSGNLDAPEGGFDAIMQAIACRDEVGWREHARRLLVFSTDAGFHYAGDGKLGGVITPNDGECHLDKNGHYTHSKIQDYPSISQINLKVKQNAINVIFAVTKQQIEVYKKLSEHIEGSSAAELSSNSSNVVQLVEEEYNKISSSVVMKDNATSAVKITYYSSCLEGGKMVQTNKCDGLKVGDMIYPVGINESLIVDLQMLCDCECEHPDHRGYVSNAAECNYHGTLKCGICECYDQYFGRNCECGMLDIHSEIERDRACRPDNTTIDCSGRGACVCGVCECEKRPNPEEKEVSEASVSGNLDAPEGGFDAIMQAIACRDEVGWREHARRLLVFSTDAGFHYAGDGKLGGVITPNDGECHLDKNGHYTHSKIQDYPSISQINLKVKQNAINVIFAVTKQQIEVYKKLSEHIEGSSAAELSSNSSNVVQLVEEEYNKISSSVVMKDNATSAVKITYYSSCLEGGKMVQTNKCDGLKVGDMVEFRANILVQTCPQNPRDWFQTFQIYPVGINESLIVDLQMLCDCECEHPDHRGYVSNAAECNYHGTLKCGICECYDQYFGRNCECGMLDIHSEIERDRACRPDNTTIDCSGRGACVCGVCECEKRPNPEEVISGTYCECDNFSCDRHNGLLCSGPDHGVCQCGVCHCLEGWTGTACDCRASNDTCINPHDGEICSGTGSAYVCPTCSGRCHEFKDCVQCQVYQTGPMGDDKDLCMQNCTLFTPITEEVVTADETKDEVLCTFYDEDDCRFQFVYTDRDDDKVVVRAQEERECPPKVFMLGVVLGVIAAIVLIGLAILLLWKLLTTINDRREFARFEKERMMAKWDTKEVSEASVSGNLDAPEGGFDAIMQAIACRDEVGWREHARRLLVFSTDAGFHYAGDGKLGGVITPNDGECHLDKNGHYTHSKIQDYPSISQINLKVKQNAINVIFAVTKQQIEVYKKLSEHIEGSSAAELSSNSSNVVQLVEEEYNKISSSVVMKDNATSAVKITYYSSCLEGGKMVQTNMCDGLKVGDMVEFRANILVQTCPQNPRDWFQTFQIYPVGINESLIVDLQMLCDCECEHPDHRGYVSNAAECNYHGTLKCGICECYDQYFGRNCECGMLDIHSEIERDRACRPDNTTIDCSGRGACVCGVCECEKRPNPEEVISGTYCECDNFSCDRHNGLLCSGPDHGVCQCGVCHCLEGWTGTACDCRASNDTCINPHDGEICSGNGECVCGTCNCKITDEGRYSGRYCEKCPTCSGRCHEFKDCVQCQVYQTGPMGDDKDLCMQNCTLFTPITEEVVTADETKDEVLCTFYDEDDCRFQFVYTDRDDDKVVVRAQEERECPPKVFMLGVVLGVIAAIVLIGLAILLLWKLLTTINDRREFARFEKERMMAKWDTGENPIYKQATSTFKNPTYAGK
uniref:Integrin beta n=2 Tax=Endopterygota TaxID=33392 RepID=A0A1B0CHL5_LUTLO